MKTDARDAEVPILAEESRDHISRLVGVDDEAAPFFLPKSGPAPEVGVYDQIPEVKLMRAVHPYNVFTWPQGEFLGVPT